MAEANRCDNCHEFEGSCLCFEREPENDLSILHPDDIANLPGAPDPWEAAHDSWAEDMSKVRGEMAEGAD